MCLITELKSYKEKKITRSSCCITVCRKLFKMVRVCTPVHTYNTDILLTQLYNYATGKVADH